MCDEDTEVLVGLCFKGGKTVKWHAENALAGNNKVCSFATIGDGDGKWVNRGVVCATDAMRFTDWDYITVQPYSTEKNDTNLLIPSLVTMLNLVETRAPGAKFYIYSTWGEVGAD